MATTWDPANAGSTIVFSNGNLTVHTGASTNGVFSTTSKSAGKLYFEYAEVNASNNFTGIGLANASAPVNSIANTNNMGVSFNIGEIFVNGSQLGTDAGSPIPHGGFAVDFTSSPVKAWWCSDVTAGSQNWNGSTSNAPGGAGGISLASIGTPLFIYALLQSSGEVWTLNVGNSSFAGALPTGYSAWDSGGAGSLALPYNPYRNRSRMCR